MPHKKYKQLKLNIESYRNNYAGIHISFSLNRKAIKGVLYGDAEDWYFASGSPAFLQIIPNGILKKYALWLNKVPDEITPLYNNIMDAALKSGYNIIEKEELQNL